MASSHKCYLCWFLVFGIVGIGLHLTGFILPGWLNMRRSELDISLGVREMIITEKLRATGFMMIDHGGKLPMLQDGSMPPMDDERRPPHGKDDHDGRRQGPGGDRHPPKPNRMWDHDEKEKEEQRKHEHGKEGWSEEEMKEKWEEMARKKEEMMANGGKPGEMMEKQKSSGPEMMKFEENIELIELLEQVTAEVTRVDVSVRYGLWFSKICVHMSKPNGEEMEEAGEMIGQPEMEDRDDDSSSSSSSEDGHHGRHRRDKHCKCKKVKTSVALNNAFLFQAPSAKHKHNIGYASIKEHQAEATIGLILMVLGLITGIACLKKPNGCRCIKIVTIVTMVIAIVLIAVPVGRLAHYSHYRRHLHNDVSVKCPISTYLSGTGCIMILFSAIVTLCSFFSSRKESPGRWYQFNNELQVEKKPEKGPALVFYEPYPVKAGLVDAVDFSNLKPEEFVEPEKKPLE